MFADRQVEDKFDGLDWAWDGGAPAIAGTLAYRHCRAARASTCTTTRS